MKRITARVRHGRRQQHINLPPSGLGGIGHGRTEDGAAKHSANYRDRKKAEAERLGIEKVFFNMPAGIKKAIAAEIEAHGYDRFRNYGRTWRCHG